MHFDLVDVWYDFEAEFGNEAVVMPSLLEFSRIFRAVPVGNYGLAVSQTQFVVEGTESKEEEYMGVLSSLVVATRFACLSEDETVSSLAVEESFTLFEFVENLDCDRAVKLELKWYLSCGIMDWLWREMPMSEFGEIIIEMGGESWLRWAAEYEKNAREALESIDKGEVGYVVFEHGEFIVEIANLAVVSGGAWSEIHGSADFEQIASVVDLLVSLEQAFDGCSYVSEYLLFWEDFLDVDSHQAADYASVLLRYLKSDSFCFESKADELEWRVIMFQQIQSALHSSEYDVREETLMLVEEVAQSLNSPLVSGGDKFSLNYILAEEEVCFGNYFEAISGYQLALNWAQSSADSLQMFEDIYSLECPMADDDREGSARYWQILGGRDVDFYELVDSSGFGTDMRLAVPHGAFPFIEVFFGSERVMIILEVEKGWLEYPLMGGECLLSFTWDEYGGCLPYRRKGDIGDLSEMIPGIVVEKMIYAEEYYMVELNQLSHLEVVSAGFVQESEAGTGHTQDLRYDTFYLVSSGR